MFDKLEKVLGPLASKLSSNKVLAAIRDGFLVRYTVNYSGFNISSYWKFSY